MLKINPVRQPKSNPSRPMATPVARQFSLRISVTQSFYTKLVQAHQSVRRPDGSRAELRELLELGIDALLRGPSTPPSSLAALDDDGPPTVRAPVTERWPPSSG